MGVAVRNPRDGLMPLPKLDLARGSPNRVHQGRSRRSPTKSQNRSPPPPPAKTVVVGEVKLLRRGEELTVTPTVLKSPPADRVTESRPGRAESRRAESSTRNRLAESGRVVEPAARPIKAYAESTRVEVAELASFYAGGAFITSPPPSSLPVPAFCAKRADSPSFVDATSDLRKLLRLE